MKKFIAGVVVGHILTNFLFFYADGGVDRLKNVLEFTKDNPGQPVDFMLMMKYVMQGNPYGPPEEEQDESLPLKPLNPEGAALKLWFQRILRIRAMSHEGYSVDEISDILSLPKETVIEVLKFEEEEVGEG